MASDVLTRHQCMIYAGSAARTLPALVAAIKQRLATRFRCIYFNSPAMVAGVRSQLYAAGMDVEHEVSRGSLVLAGDDSHLVDGRFQVDGMIDVLDAAVRQALADGYLGLFATGDMTWEFGPERDFSKLLEYEWRLEQLFHKHSSLSGVCQYHCDLLPREAVREGFVSHATIFVSDTLSRVNPAFVVARTPHDRRSAVGPGVDQALEALLAVEP